LMKYWKIQEVKIKSCDKVVAVQCQKCFAKKEKRVKRKSNPQRHPE
uniref:Uncharacterized protein n=1 Tax=Loxodonta africana TaxID=9785 RepID=G3TVE1_LOXAF